jgi:hypothetical protein
MLAASVTALLGMSRASVEQILATAEQGIGVFADQSAAARALISAPVSG